MKTSIGITFFKWRIVSLLIMCFIGFLAGCGTINIQDDETAINNLNLHDPFRNPFNGLGKSLYAT